MSNLEIEAWDALLESEGLGVIAVDDHWHGVGVKHITGKHRRLDCVINGVFKESDGIMTNSPLTARAVETRFSDAESEQEDFDDGLWDDDEDGDDVWDMLILSLTGSPKEAEIANRRRGALFGLDDKNRPRGGKIRRQRGESDEHFMDRVAERLGISTEQMGPAYTPWTPPKPDYATSDAGGGPLAMVDRPKPDYGKPREEIRMSPVVDTLGYLPGRGPYQLQLAQGGRGNSDITG
jgi:hypothetical protein